MNKATLILIGIFAAFSLSWFGMVWGPATQQAALAPVESAGEIYPHDRVGEAKQGAQVYRAQGCYQCHSQQVRQGKVRYEIQLTGLGDQLQDFKDMMQRNDLDYLKFKGPIELAYQFKGEAFTQWFENYSKGLATVEAASAALQKGTSEEAKKAAEELADAGAFFEKLCRLTPSSDGQNLVVTQLSNVSNAMASLGDPPALKAFYEGMGFISTSATTEAAAYFKLRDGVEKDSRQVVARLSGLLTKNETAALSFFQLSSNEKASLSLMGGRLLIWSSTKTEQDAKRLLAAIKGEDVGATANTRAHVPAEGAGPLWADVQRGWGVRRSVPLDYLYDDTVMLGSRRMGPDLAHVGGRLIAKAKAEYQHDLDDKNNTLSESEIQRQAVERVRKGIYRHLYNPKSVVEKSVMPPFTHLFERRPVNHAQAGTELAANHPDGFLIEGGRYFVTPKPAARVLVAYLLSLNQRDLVPEAPTTAMERAEKTDPQ